MRDGDSLASVLRRLGLYVGGSNYAMIRRAVRRLALDTRHWTGASSRLGKKFPTAPAIPLAQVLVEHSTYSRSELKRRLIRDGLLKNECAICQLAPSWNGLPLVLVLDHINGTNDDARFENLRLLCPNCNSQQDTFAGRRLRSIRIADRKPRPTLHTWPSREAFLEMVERMPATHIAKELGVSNVSVRKHCLREGIRSKPRGYWAAAPHVFSGYLLGAKREDAPDALQVAPAGLLVPA